MPNSSKRRLNSSKLLSKLSLSSVPREKFGELFEVGSSEDLCFMGCHLHTVVVPGGVHEVLALMPYKKPKFTGLAFLRSSPVTWLAGFPVIFMAVAMWISSPCW